MQEIYSTGRNFLVERRNRLNLAHFQLLRRNDLRTVKELGAVAGAFIFLAGVLFVSAGYHAGFQAINGVSYALAERFLHTLTFLGDTCVGLALMLPFARRNPAVLAVVLFAGIYGLLLTHGMKAYFDMPRPAAVLEHGSFFQTGHSLTRHSFPSGHSLSAFIAITTFYYFAKHSITKALLLFVGCAVAASRVLVGAHWPIDVLVGSALGILVTLLAVASAKRCRWVFSPLAHFVVVALVAAAAFILLNHDGGYPAARLFAVALSVSVLAHFVFDYVILNVLALPRRSQTEALSV